MPAKKLDPVTNLNGDVIAMVGPKDTVSINPDAAGLMPQAADVTVNRTDDEPESAPAEHPGYWIPAEAAPLVRRAIAEYRNHKAGIGEGEMLLPIIESLPAE